MNRIAVRVLAASIAAGIAVSVGGCAPARGVSVSESNAGEKVTLSVGQQMEIALASNPTTGYSWQVADDAGGIVKLSGEPEYVQDPGPAAVGRGGAERLTFEAVKAGRGALVLEYRRPWEKDVEPHKTFEIPVEVK